MPTLQYPPDVGDFQRYPAWMLINIFKRDGLTDKATVEFANIALLMPDVPSHNTSSQWSPVGFGVLGDTIIHGSQNFEAGNYRQMVDTVVDVAGGKLAGTVGTLLASLAATTGGASIAGKGEQLIGAKLGVVQNPYLTAVYNGVTNRSFTMSFQFTPKTPEDCKTIKLISETLLFSSLPNRAGNSYYMGYPYEFEIEFRIRDKINNWIQSYSSCVMTDIRIDDSTQNSFYSSFRNGFPTSKTITMSFLEKEMPAQRTNNRQPVSSYSELESLILSDISEM